MAVNLSPVYGVAGQLFNDNGDPLAGGKIYTYSAGTTTPAPTYTTSAGNIAHSNPIVLDGAGRVPGGEIWLTDGIVYKFVVEDAASNLIGTYDNLSGINSNFIAYTSQQEIQTATAGQTVFTLTTMQYQPATNNLSVFVDGVNQYGPGAQYAYVETNSTTVTFVNGLHLGAEVKFTTATPVASSATDAENVSYTPPYVGAITTNVENSLAQYVSVKDFGAVGDGIVDDTAALQTARDYLAGLALAGKELPTLIFPAGVYKYSVSPNWAINKVRLQSMGVVRMRYTGTGNAFIIDGVGQSMYGLYFGRFIIEAPSTAGHGVFIRVVQHSTFDFQVRGCGSTSAGIYVAFSVCSLFINTEVSVNDGGWYLGAKPYYGMYLTNYVVGLDNGDCSYCTFINPIIEGTEQGIYCHSALGNTFLGGTSEGIIDTALIVSAASRLNKFYSIDFEVNLGDVLCYGYENEFHGIDSNVYFAFMSGSRDNLIVGGRFKTLYLEAGALDNTIVGARYNVYSGGSYSDNGTRTRARDLVNVQTHLHHNSLPSQTTGGPTGSPYSYTNQTGNNMMINVVGGTVTALGITRNSVTNYLGYLNGSVMLCPQDSLYVEYSVAPTFVFLNQ